MKKHTLILTIVAVSLTDFGTTILCTKWLGATSTYALFAVPMFIGLFIQWRHHQAQKLRKKPILPRGKKLAEVTREEQEFCIEEMSEIFSWALVTILLLIPGLVTASIGFALMIPSLNRSVKASISKYFFDSLVPHA